MGCVSPLYKRKAVLSQVSSYLLILLPCLAAGNPSYLPFAQCCLTQHDIASALHIL